MWISRCNCGGSQWIEIVQQTVQRTVERVKVSLDTRVIIKRINIRTRQVLEKQSVVKKWLRTGSADDEMKYKNYRKCYKKVLYEAEKNYYTLQFDLKTNSVKPIWRNLNSVVSMSKIKNKVNIPKLTVNDSEVTNTKEICN